jgi:hypothetical protein
MASSVIVNRSICELFIHGRRHFFNGRAAMVEMKAQTIVGLAMAEAR